MNNIKKFVGIEKCCGCGVCALVCNSKAIQMKPDDEGFLQPFIDENKCANCGLCVKKCPIINERKGEYSEKWYLGYSKDKNTLLQCTSGGIASELYKHFIESDGMCFGVKYKDNFEGTVFGQIENLSSIKSFSGTKYAQAEKEYIFRNVKSCLEQGKKCLFIGTPCEVAALKIFCQKDSENLYTAQLICMGVTSPFLFREYVKSISKGKKIKSIKERLTEQDWNYPLFNIEYANGSISRHMYDSTLYAYAVKTGGRKSCYNCKFKGENRVADITIGDFWGANRQESDFEEKGMSLICSHTEKGWNLINAIRTRAYIKELEDYNPEKGNPYIYISRKDIEKRDKFFFNINQYGFCQGVYKTMAFSEKCKWGVSSLIPKKVWPFIHSLLKKG